MNLSKKALIAELFFLFILIPCLLVTPLLPLVKVAMVLLGVVYVVRISILQKWLSIKILLSIPSHTNWKSILIRFSFFLVCSSLLMYYFNPEKLFIVVLKNPLLWIGICFIYSAASVFPQEFLYRSFFFRRYSEVFKNPTILLIVNAFLFSLAHIGFKNNLVLVLTLGGGFIFAITYLKTKSLTITSIEHALYGCWLFTLGMGEMLSFPMPS